MLILFDKSWFFFFLHSALRNWIHLFLRNIETCIEFYHLVSQLLHCVSAFLRFSSFSSLLFITALLLCVVVPRLRLTASLQAECVSHVTVTHMVRSRLTVMRLVNVVVSRVSPDPNVTAAHEDSSTSKRAAVHVSTDTGISLHFKKWASLDYSSQNM